MGLLEHVGYRIESAWIKQYEGVSREVWFLDEVVKSSDGHQGTMNICNGSKEYCQEMLNTIRNEPFVQDYDRGDGHFVDANIL